MRWHVDMAEAEWTATVTRDALVRVVRRVISPPYREGGEPREEFTTFEFAPDEAAGLAAELVEATKVALDGVPE